MVFATSIRNSGFPSLGHTGELDLYTLSIFRAESAFLPDSWFRAWNGVAPQKMFVEVNKILNPSDNSSTQKRRGN